jgi:hypothetical protein
MNWKKIIDYPSYEVSDAGQVRRVQMTEDFVGNPIQTYKILKQNQVNGNFLKVSLSSQSQGTKTYYINKLVAQYFVPNPNNFSDIRHIDGNKMNNHYSNLEWYDKHKETHKKKQNERNKREAEKLIEKAKEMLG